MPTSQEVVVFFSCPSDLAESKAAMAEVVEELAPIFASRGILVRPWRHEVDARPTVARVGESIQNTVDRQLPRESSGDLGYHLYVGMMCQRLGTPTEKAPSGTIHEFIDAKESFDRRGTPKILFYFCRKALSDGAEGDVQTSGIEDFRRRYPGLFAVFDGRSDLLTQFRRHIVAELLDILQPPKDRYVQRAIHDRDWVRKIEHALREQQSNDLPNLAASAEVPRLILRQLEELIGVEQTLEDFEKEVLTACIYLTDLGSRLGPERVEELLGAGRLSRAAVAIFQLVDNESEIRPIRSVEVADCRSDLVAALVMIGHRLGMDRRANPAESHGTRPPDSADLRTWASYLTREIRAVRGVLTYYLEVPGERWTNPLKGVTALAMEALWQRLRNTLTRYGIGISVARSHVELNPDLADIPSSVLQRIQEAAVPVSALLPSVDHLGTGGWPEVEDLVPLPQSRVCGPTVFQSDRRFSRRLLVDGKVAAALPEEEPSDLVLSPDWLDAEKWSVCALEVDEGGGFESQLEVQAARLGDAEQAIVDRALGGGVPDDVVPALASFGLFNNLLSVLWPAVQAGTAASEEAALVYRILHDAFEQLNTRPDARSLDRRDVYFNAMDRVREQMGTRSKEAKQ